MAKTQNQPQTQTTTQERPAQKTAKELLDEVISQTDAKGKALLVSGALDQRRDRIEKILPPSLKGQAERLTARAVMTFAASDDLQGCPPEQFVRCVIRAAEMGLAIDGRLCYVVRYKGNWQVQADYKGLVAVAKRIGQIKDAVFDVVCPSDSFSFERIDGAEKVYHCYGADHGKEVVAGKMVGAYATLILPDGSARSLYMQRAELDKVKAMAPAKAGPWATWESEMEKKTPLKRLLKLYCEDPGIAELLAEDDYADAARQPTNEQLANRLAPAVNGSAVETLRQHYAEPAKVEPAVECDPHGIPLPPVDGTLPGLGANDASRL